MKLNSDRKGWTPEAIALCPLVKKELIMIIDHYLEQDQEQRELEALNAIEEELDKEADLYGAGKFDAVIGAEPDPVLTANESYRRGYHDSFWHFYLKKYGIKSNNEEF